MLALTSSDEGREGFAVCVRERQQPKQTAGTKVWLVCLRTAPGGTITRCCIWERAMECGGGVSTSVSLEGKCAPRCLLAPRHRRGATLAPAVRQLSESESESLKPCHSDFATSCASALRDVEERVQARTCAEEETGHHGSSTASGCTARSSGPRRRGERACRQHCVVRRCFPSSFEVLRKQGQRFSSSGL